MNYIQTAILQKKKIELMHVKTTQAGFSFLELMVVFALLTLLGAFVVPNFFKNKQGAERKEFLQSFESLLKDAILRSIMTHEMHQIYLDIAHQAIQTRTYDAASIETNQHKKFKQVKDADYLTQINFLKRFTIQNFYINGVDEVVPGNAMQDVMFYVMPDGTSQAIMVNLVDQDEDGLTADIPFSFQINPFYARMTTYDAFSTP